VHDYPGVSRLDEDHFALGGSWALTAERAEAVAGATLRAHVRGKSVYLVLGSRTPGAKVDVIVDGRHERTVVVRGQRLYTLMQRPRPGDYQLELRFQPGVAGYAFTFG